ncbi:hypothetical protein M5K25_013420 [Dendrobium thyrsiflorum]|uniref:Uncharacterized protein n=1 Tax=Dendrobium thyrsiflorum TaxID=117978 RepID=A0ABD0USW4_DENTH
MGSLMVENIPKKCFIPSISPKDHNLPISQTTNKLETNLFGLRRSISSFSSSATSTWGTLCRCKSAPAFIGEDVSGPLQRWWIWGLAWLLAIKPGFRKDLEMNEEEALMLSFKRKGSLRHIFFKIGSDVRRIARSETLPTTYR